MSVIIFLYEIITYFNNAILFFPQIMHIIYHLEFVLIVSILVDVSLFLYPLVKIIYQLYFIIGNSFLFLYIQFIPVDCDPTTAIIGRLIYKFTSDFRMISCRSDINGISFYISIFTMSQLKIYYYYIS